METIEPTLTFLATPKEKIDSFIEVISRLDLPFGGKFTTDTGAACVHVKYTVGEITVTRHPSFEHLIAYNDMLLCVYDVCREILGSILTTCIIGEEVKRE